MSDIEDSNMDETTGPSKGAVKQEEAEDLPDASDASSVISSRAGLGDALKEVAYEEPAFLLNNSLEVLFEDPTRSSSGHTYWITGAKYVEGLDHQPTVVEMDNVRSIIRDRDGNYHPKATFPYSCAKKDKTRDQTSYKEKMAIATEILQNNGLSGETYSGMVAKIGFTGEPDYELGFDERIVETKSGPRRQQRRFRYPEHAGIENENHLLIKENKDGTVEVESFDIRANNGFSAYAKLTAREAGEKLGGKLLHKSERTNSYHTTNHLRDNGRNPDAAEERFQHLTGQDRNTNRGIPEVGVLINGSLFDVKLILKNQEMNPYLVAAIKDGSKKVAPLIKVRSPTGGYWSPGYAAQQPDFEFTALCEKHGIDKRLGHHKFTATERENHAKGLPSALVQTSKGILTPVAQVQSTLGPGETVARKYGEEKILLANRDSKQDAFGTGFFTQLKNANSRLHQMLPKAVRAIYTDATGKYSGPDLSDAALSKTNPKERDAAKGDYKHELPARSGYQRTADPRHYEERNRRRDDGHSY